ncbi:MAG: hypothetical protein OHK0044_16230 [Burkholderiaceae bacterium]
MCGDIVISDTLTGQPGPDFQVQRNANGVSPGNTGNPGATLGEMSYSTRIGPILGLGMLRALAARASFAASAPTTNGVAPCRESTPAPPCC